MSLLCKSTWQRFLLTKSQRYSIRVPSQGSSLKSFYTRGLHQILCIPLIDKSCCIVFQNLLLIEKILEKFLQESFFLVEAEGGSCMATASDFVFNQVLSLLTSSFVLDNVTGSTFCFITEAQQKEYAYSIIILSLIGGRQ